MTLFDAPSSPACHSACERARERRRSAAAGLRRGAAGLVALLTLSVAWVASAASATSLIEWDAPEACRGALDVHARLSAVLGYEPETLGTLSRVRGSVVQTANGHRGQLQRSVAMDLLSVRDDAGIVGFDEQKSRRRPAPIPEKHEHEQVTDLVVEHPAQVARQAPRRWLTDHELLVARVDSGRREDLIRPRVPQGPNAGRACAGLLTRRGGRQRRYPCRSASNIGAGRSAPPEPRALGQQGRARRNELLGQVVPKEETNQPLALG